MMSEQNIKRFAKELEQIHEFELNQPPAPNPRIAIQQVEARSKLSVLYAVLEEPLPDYPCTRVRA